MARRSIRNSTSQNINLSMANSISNLGARMRTVESSGLFTPVRYTIQQAGYLVDSVLAGVTTITVSALPQGAFNLGLWVAIDVGNSECEFRKCVTLDTLTGIITFTTALAYAHSEGDPIIITTDPRMNVLWFGAIGDSLTASSTINYTAFTSAIAQAKANSGGCVFVPGGGYYIRHYLNVDFGGFCLMGDSESQTAIAADNTGGGYVGGQMFYAYNAVAINNIEIKDIFWYGPTNAGVGCVQFNNCGWIRVDGCRIWANDNTNGTAFGVRCDTCQKVKVCNNDFRYTYNGVYLSGGSSVDITENSFTLFNNWLYCTSCTQVSTDGNLITSGGVEYFPQQPVTAIPASNNYVEIREAVSEFISTLQMEATVVSGGYPDLVVLAAGHPKVWRFLNGIDCGVGFWWRPNDKYYDLMRYKFKLYWCGDDGATPLTDGNVVWRLSLSANPYQPATLGCTTVPQAFNPVVKDTCNDAWCVPLLNDLQITTFSGNNTVKTPGLWSVRLERVGTDGADTYQNPAYVFGMEVFYI